MRWCVYYVVCCFCLFWFVLIFLLFVIMFVLCYSVFVCFIDFTCGIVGCSFGIYASVGICLSCFWLFGYLFTLTFCFDLLDVIELWLIVLVKFWCWFCLPLWLLVLLWLFVFVFVGLFCCVHRFCFVFGCVWNNVFIWFCYFVLLLLIWFVLFCLILFVLL